MPVGLEQRLAPRGRTWRTFVLGIDRVRPLGHPTDSTFSGRLAAQASRDDSSSSGRALRRSVVEELLAPFARDARHPWRGRERRRPADHTNPLWDAPADPADRERYLAFVASQGTARTDHAPSGGPAPRSQ